MMTLTPDDSLTVDAGRAVDVVLTRPTVAILIVVGTWVVTRLARHMLRRSIRRVADRAVLQGPGSLWRARVQRVFGETAEVAEKRRRQRIDAMSRMLGHLFSLVAWLTAFILVLHVMQVDLIPILTSAGFIGAALAIGGQHAVKDFISGIGILVEDRFGVGDRVVVETATGKEVDGVVEHVGAFSTRLSSDGSTYHFANGSVSQVRNLSQHPVTTEIEVSIPSGIAHADTPAAADAVALALARAAGDRRLTGMVLVDDVKTAVRTGRNGRSQVKVAVRTAQPLTGSQAAALHRVAENALWRVPSVGDSEGGEAD